MQRIIIILFVLVLSVGLIAKKSVLGTLCPA